MNKSIPRALRPWSAVAIVAALVVLMLPAMLGGKPAAAAQTVEHFTLLPSIPADGKDGDDDDTAAPPTLSLSQSAVRPNASIVIQGSGFGTAAHNKLTRAQIGGIALLLVSDNGNLADVEISDSGQFAATFAIWPANASDHNPTLRGGTLEIEITDAAGFSGTAEVTILPPTLTITPAVAGPGGYVFISGANWPAANHAGAAISPVNINISGGGIDPDNISASTNAIGKWGVRYRVPGKVSIPATLKVQATYGADLSQTARFAVMAANLEVRPAAAYPGNVLGLNAAGFAPYDSDIAIRLASFSLPVPAGAAADGAGKVQDLTFTMPSLDAGIYTILLQVGDAVAVGEVTVLGEFIPAGDYPAPEALEPLGDNLVRVFHFNHDNRTWEFYDPRPEFAELNTLSVMSVGRPYWILVRDSDRVTINLVTHHLTCRNGSCWNRIVW